ncbi:MAG: hypothetical protein ACLGG1_05660, partial [Gammaproteobacteria bacterium]
GAVRQFRRPGAGGPDATRIVIAPCDNSMVASCFVLFSRQNFCARHHVGQASLSKLLSAP